MMMRQHFSHTCWIIMDIRSCFSWCWRTGIHVAKQSHFRNFFGLLGALGSTDATLIRMKSSIYSFTWWNESTEERNCLGPPSLSWRSKTPQMLWHNFTDVQVKAMDIDYREGKSVLRQWFCTEGRLTEPVLRQDLTSLAASLQITKNNKHAVSSPNLQDTLCTEKRMSKFQPLPWITLNKPFNLAKPQISNLQNEDNNIYFPRCKSQKYLSTW